MNASLEDEILAAEDKLRTAMLTADVDALERLLAPELVFTNHLGQVLGREDDLAAHRSGTLKVKDLKSSEQRVRLFGETAVVWVRMKLCGSYAGKPADGNFRFTRVWALSPEKSWRVVAAHSCVVP